MPVISVIIPSYNHALYIEEAILSVLKQSFQDFELIIIDDASQDNSWIKIQTIDDSRIHTVLHAQNKGASKTINEGLALAKGDYLTILNSDDSYHPKRLEKLLALNKDFIASDLNLWDEHSQPNEANEVDWVHWFENLKQQYSNTEDFLATLLKGNFLITTSNFFFSRKLYQKLNGFKDLRYVHDYEFAIRALFSDFSVAYCQEKLLNYRLHNNNTIREAPLKAIQENVALLLSLPKQFTNKFTQHPAYLISLVQHIQELYQYTNEEWATKLHHKLVNKEEELFKLIHDRDTWVEERNHWISERDQQIQKQTKLLTEHSNWLQERDQNIAQLNKKIAEDTEKLLNISRQLETQKALSDQQTTWITDRDQWIKERDVLIEKQQSWIADRDTWIAERDQIIQALNNEIIALRTSRSFRLGQKLATLLHPLKRIIKGGNYA